MTAYILAHDLGTSGNKASLMDREGRLVRSVTVGYDTHYLGENRVEQDPADWWRAVKEATGRLLGETEAKEIGAVSFSGQMMGCLITDPEGRPRHRSLIWADQRSTAQIRELEKKLDPNDFYRITGHRLSESYSLSKYLWLREHHPELTGTPHRMLNAKDYIIFKLTGRFCTDYSDAGGTNLFDLTRYEWSPEIAEAAGVDPAVLPEAYPSTAVVGEVTSQAAHETGLARGTPVVAGAGDGIAAAVGAGCLREGDCYNYIGSSSWIATATANPVFDPQRRTFIWPHIVKGLYSPCGTTQSAGGSLAWMKRELADGAESETTYHAINRLIEASPKGARGILFLPYLMGERSPLWDPLARGAFIGLAMEHTRGDVYRAVMEGVSLNLGLIYDILRGDGSVRGNGEVTLIGGGAQSAVWNQILADVYGADVIVPRDLEAATSLGAAAMGALGIGWVREASELGLSTGPARRVAPDPEGVGLYRELRTRMGEVYQGLKNLPLYISGGDDYEDD